MTAPVELPFEQANPMEPAPGLRRLQAQGPIHPVRTAVGDPAWLVTGYEQVRRLLDDNRLGRAHAEPETASRTGLSALFGGPMGDFATEEVDHRRMRSLMQPYFTPKRMRALSGRVAEITGGLLDELADKGPPADLHQALALPLPITVICELLGVPYADRAQFRDWTQAAADVTDQARSEQGLAALFEYGRGLVAGKRSKDPADDGDDVITGYARMADVDDDEAALLSMGLLFAGHETTVVAIGLGTLWLLHNRDQWEALVADPARVDTAVEEILRSPGLGGGGTGGITRYARVDLEIEGVKVRAGDLVVLDLNAANHDSAVFADPDRFDVARQGAGHLSFGYGARYCIGAPLARVELQVVLKQLVGRFPTMRLAVPAESLSINRHVLAGGLTSLPVTW
ncbi:cytochrome P450 [Sphaerisporangium sp. TRM90804]|uniref:cytochrome P450 n=1 Tax=Sphaerisporangium sp. TRM90804 TaxID=3031113 RepID=UPI00244A58CB|nr:cytochrome P450 [Sphaerisporangium sp. TRM90804]MDH2430543.1 cytochrome P450 [Sphaerisporangium sp. TRM90804]